MEIISILIPTYNNASKISRCLDSAVGQTYKNVKIIVLNDGSTDNTKEVVMEYVNKYDNVFYYENEVNKGRGYSRNRILDFVDTRLSCWLDSDDYMALDKIEIQYEYFVNNPECNLLATPMMCLLPDNKMEPGYSNYDFIKNVNLSNLKIINHIPHPTVMFKTEVVKNLKFNENMNREEDWDLYLRLYKNGMKVDVIPQLLYYYNMC
jgi:glycosyltransferase involved in cell wall biosynthesis